MCADAVRFATEIGYRNAGTVEFLLDPRRQLRLHRDEPPDPGRAHGHRGDHRRRPGAGAAPDRIAARPSHDLGLSQEGIQVRGAALQCRITTEDPANNFRPDTGVITTYRSPGGGGVRLDGGTTYTGAEISAHFDSMLSKLTCRGRTFEDAVAKARRAVAEFRIRGVTTNIAFLQAVLDDPDFRAGRITTSFIETHPQLLKARASGDRGTKLMTYLADVTVNQPHGAAPVTLDPVSKLPDLALDVPAPDGTRQLLLELGPEAFARRLREQNDVAVTDTTFRDAHQSLLATRVRSKDLLAVAGHLARSTPQLWSLECWGGATYDVALRFLSEDPWERLAALQAGGAERLPADAAPRPQHGRLHAVPHRGRHRLREGGGRDRSRRVPHLRRPQRRRADAAGDRGGPRDRDHGGRGGALLHRRPLQPRREALHARLLPAAGRADRRRRRARAGDQGHGRAAPRAGRAHAGHRPARAVRPARAPAHPRHPGRPARHPARRDRRRCRRGRRRVRLDGRYDVAAAALRAGQRDRPLRARDRAVARGGQRDGALLGGGPPGLRAVRVRAARTDRPGLPARDPGRPALQPAAAGDRARAWARSSSRSRRCTPPPTTSSATSPR